MKATETKYLLLLEALEASPKATHAELAEAADIPQSLVNRYLRRLAAWGAVKTNGRSKGKYVLASKGKRLLRQAAWQLAAFTGSVFERLHAGAVAERVLECLA